MKRIALLAVLALGLVSVSAPATGQTVVRTVRGDRCSGTIAQANTSQVATGSDNARAWLFIQNPINATEPLFVDFGPNHQASAILSTQLAPGGSISFLSGVVPSGQVNVSAATAGHTYICETGQ